MAKNDKQHRPQQTDVEEKIEEKTAIGPPSVNQDTGEISGPGFEAREAPKLESVEMVKKIVAKNIVGREALKCTKKFVAEINADGSPKLNADGAPVGDWVVTPPTLLYMVAGTAMTTRSGSSTFGEWIAFGGVFKAIRASDGKAFASRELFLQEPAQGLLLQALSDLRRRDPSGEGGIDFAFKIGKKTSQRWVDTGEGNTYEYTIESVINIKQNDPLAHLNHVFQAALPAPKA